MTVAAPARPGQRRLSEEETRRLVGAAVRAPSVHNTQPWRFRLADGRVEVWADRTRQLPVADPQGRELTISCGAAVHTLLVAMRAEGIDPVAEALPDRGAPDLLARVSAGGSYQPTASDRQLAAAIFRRHTHRGRFPSGPISGTLADELLAAALREGAQLCPVDSPGSARRLGELIFAAERRQETAPEWRQELASWTPPPDRPAQEGVPAYAYPASPIAAAAEPPVRGFDLERGWGTGEPPGSDDALLAVLVTGDDSRAAWLAAGQALQAVLLKAATRWAFAGIYTQPLEIPYLRRIVGEEASQSALMPWAQLLLRLGHAPSARPTPRRPVGEVLDVVDGA
jgi:nitroreductase